MFCEAIRISATHDSYFIENNNISKNNNYFRGLLGYFKGYLEKFLDYLPTWTIGVAISPLQWSDGPATMWKVRRLCRSAEAVRSDTSWSGGCIKAVWSIFSFLIMNLSNSYS